jgi:uncharacterized membrane protein
VLLFAVLFGVVNLLPFLAPVFMHLGWTAPARLIYTLYSPLCHQMAQRSFFLFGEQPMYNITELPVTFTENTVTDMTALRTLVGNPELGWKVAWSDRMVFMYGTVLLAGMVYGVLRYRRPIRPLGLFVFALLLAPIAIDGISHMMSDLNGGLIEGFRYGNLWLADLTGHMLPAWFYRGDALGSFNSWMRFLSGLSFGLGCVWFGFPFIDRSVSEIVAELPAQSPQRQKISSLQTFDEGSTS